MEIKNWLKEFTPIIPLVVIILFCTSVYYVYYVLFGSTETKHTKEEVAEELDEASKDYSSSIKVVDEIGDDYIVSHYINQSDKTLMVRDNFGSKKHNNNYASMILEPGQEVIEDAHLYEKDLKIVHNLNAVIYDRLKNASIDNIKVTDTIDEVGDLVITIKNTGNAIDRNVQIDVVFYDFDNKPIHKEWLQYGSYDYVINKNAEITDTISNWQIPEKYSAYNIYKSFR